MDMSEKDYLRHYHAFLTPWKEMAVRVLELSGDADRITLWKDFFPNGLVFASVDPDNDPDQRFHLILDASKVSQIQLDTFARLFPLVIPGGYYCIENVEASLDKVNWGGKRGVLGVMNQMQKDLHARQVPEMALTYPELSPRIDFMFTVPGLVVIRRNHTE